jgi:hypothetical protein
MSKTPPVPKQQQNAHGATGAPPETGRDPSRDKSGVNLDEQGQSANLRQNLTSKRAWQDR